MSAAGWLFIAGSLLFYLVTTGWLAGRRRERTTGAYDVIALALIACVSAGDYAMGMMNRHARTYEGASKDYEFSRRTMEEHWKTGYSDMERTLRHPEVLQRPQSADGVFVFDLGHQGREQEK